ncbi:hypothetical protein NDU88_000406 [Pleurodeles waltl]|uniref:Uncharacterized protein n=1 Tax=Pleurodeles waltl TaxID=8319 RepID=A0AAV7U3E8_PLEWA|nr:hypothetical protein NDU88_000406 [Pleurodeles waltl]
MNMHSHILFLHAVHITGSPNSEHEAATIGGEAWHKKSFILPSRLKVLKDKREKKETANHEVQKKKASSRSSVMSATLEDRVLEGVKASIPDHINNVSSTSNPERHHHEIEGRSVPTMVVPLSAVANLDNIVTEGVEAPVPDHGSLEVHEGEHLQINSVSSTGSPSRHGQEMEDPIVPSVLAPPSTVHITGSSNSEHEAATMEGEAWHKKPFILPSKLKVLKDKREKKETANHEVQKKKASSRSSVTRTTLENRVLEVHITGSPNSEHEAATMEGEAWHKAPFILPSKLKVLKDKREKKETDNHEVQKKKASSRSSVMSTTLEDRVLEDAIEVAGSAREPVVRWSRSRLLHGSSQIAQSILSLSHKITQRNKKKAMPRPRKRRIRTSSSRTEASKLDPEPQDADTTSGDEGSPAVYESRTILDPVNPSAVTSPLTGTSQRPLHKGKGVMRVLEQQ